MEFLKIAAGVSVTCIAAFVAYRFFKKRHSFPMDLDLAEHVIIVTGGNRGIGYQTVLALAKRNATIIMASRSMENAEMAMKALEIDLGSAAQARELVVPLKLDLADLNSVQQFVQEFLAKFNRLDILINNAGISPVVFEQSAQGYMTALAVNHLGHFALTLSLLPILRKTLQQQQQPSSSSSVSSIARSLHSGRIVNVASVVHAWVKGPFALWALEKAQTAEGKEEIRHMFSTTGSFKQMEWYPQSKLANVLFTKELARRCPDLCSVAVCPGMVFTDLYRDQGFFPRLFMRLLALSIGNSPEVGAQTILFGALYPQFAPPPLPAAVSPIFAANPLSGSFCSNLKIAPASEAGCDSDMGKRLWKISEILTRSHLPPFAFPSS